MKLQGPQAGARSDSGPAQDGGRLARSAPPRPRPRRPRRPMSHGRGRDLRVPHAQWPKGAGPKGGAVAEGWALRGRNYEESKVPLAEQRGEARGRSLSGGASEGPRRARAAEPR